MQVGGARRPLALGYTILMKDDGGRLFVADASREFKTGDRFAVALETNADGYLYLFSAENGRNPELLFPNAQIDGGANAVQAHARATFPTGASAEGEYSRIDDPPATEQISCFSPRPRRRAAGAALVKFSGRPRRRAGSRGREGAAHGGAKGERVTERSNSTRAGPARAVCRARSSAGSGEGRPEAAIVRVNDADADVLAPRNPHPQVKEVGSRQRQSR